MVILANPQDLGYPLELGYQNFLYPSEPDLRDLLLFLAERLPSDASEDADQPAGDSAIFLRAIGSQIRDQLALPWVPSLLRTPMLQRLQVGCHLLSILIHLFAQVVGPSHHSLILKALTLLSPQGSGLQQPFHASRLLLPELSSRGGEAALV